MQKVLVCAYVLYVCVCEKKTDLVCEDFMWISLQENLIQVLSVMILPPQGVKQA